MNATTLSRQDCSARRPPASLLLGLALLFPCLGACSQSDPAPVVSTTAGASSQVASAGQASGTGGPARSSGGSSTRGGASSAGASAGIAGDASAGGASGGGALGATSGAAGQGGTSAGEAGASGAAGATPTFAPCPALPAACRVMPLGDSLTAGEGGADNLYREFRQGYRLPLWLQAAAQQKHLDFVGSLQMGTDALPDKDNEGHSGWTTRDLLEGRDAGAGKLSDWLASSHPHVVLLLIGANDIIQSYDLQVSKAAYATLFDQILAASTECLLVVSTLTPFGGQLANERNGRVSELNAEIGRLVTERAAAGKHIALQDLGSRIDPARDLAPNDDVHLNVEGYAKLAAGWYEVLGPVLR